MALTRAQTHNRIAIAERLARSGHLPIAEARAQIAALRAHLALLDRVGAA